MTYHALRENGGPGAPALFTFHGTGGDETQFHDLARQIEPGARVVSPRGDVSENGANRFFRRSAEGVYDMDDFWRAARQMTDFIEDEATDASEVMGFGYSNGANVLAGTMMVAPRRFTRAALLHPLIPFSPDPVDLGGVRILVTAGERDPICPPEATRKLLEWLRRMGADVKEAWHIGGHELRREEIEALDRFLSQD